MSDIKIHIEINGKFADITIDGGLYDLVIAKERFIAREITPYIEAMKQLKKDTENDDK